MSLQRHPDWRERLVAELAGRPIGFVQIIDPAREQTHYWGEVEENLRAIDIWIGEADCLGKGYGTRMMHLFSLVGAVPQRLEIRPFEDSVYKARGSAQE